MAPAPKTDKTPIHSSSPLQPTPHSILQNQGKTAFLPVLPPMARLHVKERYESLSKSHCNKKGPGMNWEK
jgi:hypothetical protein